MKYPYGHKKRFAMMKEMEENPASKAILLKRFNKPIPRNNLQTIYE